MIRDDWDYIVIIAAVVAVFLAITAMGALWLRHYEKMAELGYEQVKCEGSVIWKKVPSQQTVLW